MTSYFQGTNATLTVTWPTDVTVQTIKIIRVSDATVVVGPTGVGIQHLAVGLYSYTWAIGVAETPGDYAVVWDALNALLVPVQQNEIITVANASTAVEPCSWTIDTSCCDDWDAFSPTLQANAAAYASLALWAATGRQYGLCPITVRPCGNWCTDDGVGGWYWGGGMFLPYIVDGTWRNCWCGCNGGSCCSCAPSCQVYLPGPVGEIIQVTVDGVVVDPATYRVDDQRWLVRTGEGNCWPDCQDYNVNTGAGTFFVTYTRGEQPPAPLLAAAGTLACEWAKACMGQACRLTPYITGLTRQGVSFTAVDPMTLLDLGFTGLFEVDTLIRALNPYGTTHRMRLLSPDVDLPRMTTWP